MCMLLHMVMLAINGPFGNIIIVMLFVFFENMCEWKSMRKYVQCCLNTENCFLNNGNKPTLNIYLLF